jgi:hypothetical protein
VHQEKVGKWGGWGVTEGRLNLHHAVHWRNLPRFYVLCDPASLRVVHVLDPPRPREYRLPRELELELDEHAGLDLERLLARLLEREEPALLSRGHRVWLRQGDGSGGCEGWLVRFPRFFLVRETHVALGDKDSEVLEVVDEPIPAPETSKWICGKAWQGKGGRKGE